MTMNRAESKKYWEETDLVFSEWTAERVRARKKRCEVWMAVGFARNKDPSYRG